VAINIVNGNVLDARAEGIILTIDGAGRGMEGNTARAFARRWKDTWRKVEHEIPYPLGLGKVFNFALSSPAGHFMLILVASTLNHKKTVSEGLRKGIVRTAIEASIKLATLKKTEHLATSLMKGGWRLPALSAFMAMSDGYELAASRGHRVSLDIYIQDQDEFETILALAGSLGW
jgi:hypothetical protein